MSGFQAIWDFFSKHENKAFIQYRLDVKRIGDNKINMVAVGGGNMTHHEEEPSERDQHDSSQKPMGRRWRISAKLATIRLVSKLFLLSC
jgi:hypothetical protein